MNRVRKVRVQYERDGDTWVADSPDVPGFTAVANTLAELRPLAREGIHFFLGEAAIVIDDLDLFVDALEDHKDRRAAGTLGGRIEVWCPACAYHAWSYMAYSTARIDEACAWLLARHDCPVDG